MPRIELPAGVTEPTVAEGDRRWARDVQAWQRDQALARGRAFLRDARRLRRRGMGRPAAKRSRGLREIALAADKLVAAGVCCGIEQLIRHDMTPGPERIASIRERCEERHNQEPGEFAVAVENWIHDLAGEARLTREDST